jgi:hypothetical protein
LIQKEDVINFDCLNEEDGMKLLVFLNSVKVTTKSLEEYSRNRVFTVVFEEDSFFVFV